MEQKNHDEWVSSKLNAEQQLLSDLWKYMNYTEIKCCEFVNGDHKEHILTDDQLRIRGWVQKLAGDIQFYLYDWASPDKGSVGDPT